MTVSVTTLYSIKWLDDSEKWIWKGVESHNKPTFLEFSWKE